MAAILRSNRSSRPRPLPQHTRQKIKRHPKVPFAFRSKPARLFRGFSFLAALTCAFAFGLTNDFELNVNHAGLEHAELGRSGA